jgi:hypothetical protein
MALPSYLAIGHVSVYTDLPKTSSFPIRNGKPLGKDLGKDFDHNYHYISSLYSKLGKVYYCLLFIGHTRQSGRYHYLVLSQAYDKKIAERFFRKALRFFENCRKVFWTTDKDFFAIK